MKLRLPIMSQILMLRGKVAEADEAMARADAFGGDEEPQGEIPKAWTEAMLAETHGRTDDAIERLRHGVALSERYAVDTYPQLHVDLVRGLLVEGDVDGAHAVRASVDGAWSPLGRACARAIDGLLAEDAARAVEHLRAAVDALDAIGARIEVARLLLDLGRAERRAGLDPRRRSPGHATCSSSATRASSSRRRNENSRPADVSPAGAAPRAPAAAPPARPA